MKILGLVVDQNRKEFLFACFGSFFYLVLVLDFAFWCDFKLLNCYRVVYESFMSEKCS